MVAFRRPTKTTTNRGGGLYDDMIAVVWTDARGKHRVVEIKANTDPSANYRGRMGEDADGDGRLDQGRLPKGFYEYEFCRFRGQIALRIPYDAKVERDTNWDGRFNSKDKPPTSPGGADSMLIHQGGVRTTGSAGCQTAPPDEYARLIKALRDAGLQNNQRVGYTLLDWNKQLLKK